MKITLTWPFGTYKPGAVVDVAPEIAATLIPAGFARAAGAAPADKDRKAPTVTDIVEYATANGLSIADARRAMANDRMPRRSPPN